LCAGTNTLIIYVLKRDRRGKKKKLETSNTKRGEKGKRESGKNLSPKIPP
jgi:hypothetical protein